MCCAAARPVQGREAGDGNVLVTGQGAAAVFGTETLITDTEQVQFRIVTTARRLRVSS